MSKDINSFAENMRLVVQNQTNCISILNGIQQSLYANTETVEIPYVNAEGATVNYSIPSYPAMTNRLEAIERSLNSIVSLSGSIHLNDGTSRQLRLDPVASAPARITSVGNPSTFQIDANWFFENLMFPSAIVKIDLTNKVEDSADRCLIKRVILNSNDEATKNIWPNISEGNLGYLQLVSYLSQNNIAYSEDEQEVSFPLSIMTGEGTFQVSRVLNVEGQVWYELSGISYYTVSEDGVSNSANRILEKGDKLSYDGAVYVIEDLNTASSRVRLAPHIGANGIGEGTILNYYEDPFKSKTVNVHFGPHEYDIVYFKAVNENYNLLSSSWSDPIAFETDSLVFEDNQTQSFSNYYLKNIMDWGSEWIEQAREKRILAQDGYAPNAPTLNANDFRVVQINTQVKASIDKSDLMQTAADIESVKGNINSLKLTIAAQKTELQSIKSVTEYNKVQQQIDLNTTELSQLQNQYSTNVRYLQSLVAQNAAILVTPKYRIRGFFPMPALKYLDPEQTMPIEVIGFDIAYRYIKEDNTGTDLNTFTYVDPSTGQNVTGTFSDWNIVQSAMKEKALNLSTNKYEWVAESVADGTVVNINQVDIPITKGEKVQIKVRSISEAGYPSNPLKSGWSDSVIISFPENLNTKNEMTSIVQSADSAILDSTIRDSLASNGLIAHIADSISNVNSVNGIYYRHEAKNLVYQRVNSSTGEMKSVSIQDALDQLFDAIEKQDITKVNYQIKDEESGTVSYMSISDALKKLNSKVDTLSVSTANAIQMANFNESSKNANLDEMMSGIDSSIVDLYKTINDLKAEVENLKKQ